MEKILVANKANQINRRVLDFACFIAKLTHSKLTGIFLKNFEEPAAVAGESLHIPHDEFIDAGLGIRLWDDNIRLFKETCENRGANCTVHLSQGVPVAGIIAHHK
jgi:hypothetical protein